METVCWLQKNAATLLSHYQYLIRAVQERFSDKVCTFTSLTVSVAGNKWAGTVCTHFVWAFMLQLHYELLRLTSVGDNFFLCLALFHHAFLPVSTKPGRSPCALIPGG